MMTSFSSNIETFHQMGHLGSKIKTERLSKLRQRLWETGKNF